MRITFLLAWIFAGLLASAQGTIRGTVLDSATAKPVDKLTVTLQGTGNRQTTTDSLGRFVLTDLPFGKHTLVLSGVGFQQRFLPVSLTSENKALVINTTLAPGNSRLQNITVTANKALVEDKGDRLVYNAAADISNSGGTAADVLRKVPSLTVDLEGNIQMRGNGNIKVMVNGMPSAMMARNLADALRQMPASNIKSVEVITSPGAKYDAEGAAGVINIITKRGLRGASGSVTATGGDRNRSLGFSLSTKTGKTGLNVSATGYQNRREFEASAVRTTLSGGVPVNTLYRENRADNTGTGGYGELAFDYDPDSTHHLNLSVNAWGGDFPNGATTWLRLTDPAGSVLQNFRNESKFTNPYGNGQMDLGWTKTFKRPEQEFSLLGQFSRMPDNYFYTTDRITPEEEIIFREKSTNYSRNKEYTAQMDYTHPVQFRSQKDTSTLKIEIGTKAILRDIGSEARVSQSLNGKDDLLPDPSQTNDFDYTQRVYSGYTSLRWSNKAKWSLAAGARLEHTEISGNFITNGTRINNSYNNLIPSITVSKGVQAHNFKISYTQRITRPQIWFLNPWVNRADPKAITTGTPTLEPELNHATELGHSFSTKGGTMLNTALYWRLTDNAIEYISRMDTAGISISQPRNIARRATYGINMNVNAKPNKDWNLNGGGDLRYVDVVAPAQKNKGWMWNVNLNTTYKLPKEYTLQGNGGVHSGWLLLQRTISSIGYWYGLSVKKAFWEQKGSLTFSTNNPFTRGVKMIGSETGPGFFATSEALFVNRSFRLTFEWRFGQIGTDGGRKGKKITNDDSGR